MSNSVTAAQISFPITVSASINVDNTSLENRVAQLETDVINLSIQADLATVATSISVVEAALSATSVALNDRITSISSEITTRISTTSAALRADITSVVNRVAANSVAVTSALTSINQVLAAVSGINTALSVADLRNEIASVNTIALQNSVNITSVNDRLTLTSTRLSERIASVESELAASVAKIRTSVSNIKTSLTGIIDEVNQFKPSIVAQVSGVNASVQTFKLQVDEVTTSINTQVADVTQRVIDIETNDSFSSVSLTLVEITSNVASISAVVVQHTTDIQALDDRVSALENVSVLVNYNYVCVPNNAAVTPEALTLKTQRELDDAVLIVRSNNRLFRLPTTTLVSAADAVAADLAVTQSSVLRLETEFASVTNAIAVLPVLSDAVDEIIVRVVEVEEAEASINSAISSIQGAIETSTDLDLSFNTILNRASFTPTDLFTSTTDGGWWDFSDKTTLYTSIVDGVVVESSGEEVALIADKSGNNYDLNAKAGRNRGVFVSNEAGVKTVFNGFYENASALPAAITSSSYTLIAAYDHEGDNDGLTEAVIGFGESTEANFHYWGYAHGTSTLIATYNYTANQTLNDVSVARNVKNTLIAIVSGSTARTYFNGILVGDNNNLDELLSVGHVGFGALERNSQSAFGPAVVKFREAVILNRAITAQELENVHTYLIQKHYDAPKFYRKFYWAGGDNVKGLAPRTRNAPEIPDWRSFIISTTNPTLVRLSTETSDSGSFRPAFTNRWFELTGEGCIHLDAAVVSSSFINSAAFTASKTWVSIGDPFIDMKATHVILTSIENESPLKIVSAPTEIWGIGDRDVKASLSATPAAVLRDFTSIIEREQTEYGYNYFGLIELGYGLSIDDARYDQFRAAQNQVIAQYSNQPAGIVTRVPKTLRDTNNHDDLANNEYLWRQTGHNLVGTDMAETLYNNLYRLGIFTKTLKGTDR